MFSRITPKPKKQPEQISQPPSQIFHSGFNERAWLKSHGKQNRIMFPDHVLTKLRKYFNSLDRDGSGAITVEELEDPFIAFGLSQTRQDVQELIKSVDLDGSGEIEFDEFLEIMLKIKRGKSGGGTDSAMLDFFQRMSTGQLGQQFDNNMSFILNVSHYRRRKLLESMMSTQKQKKQKGTKILNNFKKQISTHPLLRETFNESKKGSMMMCGLDSKGIKKIH